MSRPTDPPRAEGAWDLPWATVAALVGAALYARTVGYGWVFDDQMDVVLNAYVQSWQHVGSLLTTTVWTGSGMETGLWRPVTSLSFLVNHSLSGLAPWSFHLVNLVLHAGVAALVVQLGRTWGLPAAAAGIGGILFAVHPAFVEVVAPASGRKDLLAALFVLLFLLAHDRARKEGGAWVFAAVGALAGAALSKESGFMALPLLAATEAIRSRSALAPFRDPYARPLWAAYGAAAAALVMARWSVTGGLAVGGTEFWDNPLVGSEPWVRVATSITVLGRGIATLLLPLTRSPDYSFDAIPLVTSPGDPRLWLSLVILAAPVLAAWRLRRSAPWLGLAVAWYALAALPGSNLVVLTGTIFGDRLLYLPAVAVCLTAGAALDRLRGWRPRTGLSLAAGVAAALAVQSFRYNGAWRSDIALFEWAVEAVPRSTKAHHKLGEEYLRAGRAGEALPHLDRALEIAPDNVFAAATRRQAVQRLVETHPDVFRDPMGAPLPQDPATLRALADLLDVRGQADGAARLRRAAGEGTG